jgi:hypothetical protein
MNAKQNGMLPLVLQGLPYTGFCLLAVGGGWLNYFIDRRSVALHPEASFLLGFFLLLGVCAPLIVREVEVTQSKAYAFLRTLPVTDREIVASRFLLSLVDLSVCWLIVLLGLALLKSSPGALVLHVAYITLWSFLALIIASLWHLGVFGLGFGRVLPALCILLVFLLLLSLILYQWFEFEETQGFPPLVYFLAGIHWTIWLIVAGLLLAAYYGFMRAATRVKSSSEAYL